MATRPAFDTLLPVRTVVDDDGEEYVSPLLRIAGATVTTEGTGETATTVVTPAEGVQLATTGLPAAASGSGVLGTSDFAARADHAHPAGAGDFDANAATVILAGTTTTAVRVGDDSPANYPTADMFVSSFRARDAAGGFDLLLTGGTSSLDCDDFEGSVESWSMVSAGAHAVTAPISTIAAATSHTVTSPAVSHVVTTWGITGSGAATQTCTTWGLTASGACTVSAASFALTTTGAALLNGTPIRLFWAVRAISTVDVTVATVSTVDGQALADGELFAPVAQTDPTENGIYAYVSGAGDNVRVAGFDSLAEYHLGTTVIAYAGATNKGARYFLEALSSSLPATWTAVPGTGGGSSITDGTATWALASGSLSTTGTVDAAIVASNDASLAGANETVVGHASTGSTAVRGPSVVLQTSNLDASLDLIDNAVELYSGGTLDIEAVSSLTETVGSASRTVTPSGASRTEAYNGSLALSIDFGFQSTAYTNGHSWFSNNRTHRMADVSGLSEIIARPGTAADASISTATTTTIATFSPDARPSTYHVVVHLWDVSGNCAVWDVAVSALLFGGAAVLSGSPPTGIAPTRSIGTPSGSPTLTIDVSTTTVRVRVTTTDTTAVTAACPTLEKK